MHLSQLPISCSELTILSAGASVSAVIPIRKDAMNDPWAFSRMPGYMDEVVIVGGRSHDHTVDVAPTQEIGWFQSALTGVANIVFRSDYSGLRCGIRAFRRECLKVLNGLSRPPATCACLGSLTSPQPS